MKLLLKLVHRVITSILFDPLIVIYKWRGAPYFIYNLRKYHNLNKEYSFRIRPSEIYYTAYERFGNAGTARNHYFWLEQWAARRIHIANIKHHVDIGSRIDGFVGNILPYCKVTYVDIRPLNISIEGLEIKQGTIMNLPFNDATLTSLSSLHVIEHIGLGRYGDTVEPEGYRRAARELVRVLAFGGTLLVGTPVGRERLCYDAHRVFDPETVLGLFSELTLKEFSLIDDNADRIISGASFRQARSCEYGCGLFMFRR